MFEPRPRNFRRGSNINQESFKHIRNLGGYEAAAETLKRPLVK